MEQHKHLLDLGAAVGAAATFMGWLPNIAAGLAIIWYLIRMYEYFKSKKLS